MDNKRLPSQPISLKNHTIVISADSILFRDPEVRKFILGAQNVNSLIGNNMLNAVKNFNLKSFGSIAVDTYQKEVNKALVEFANCQHHPEAVRLVNNFSKNKAMGNHRVVILDPVPQDYGIAIAKEPKKNILRSVFDAYDSGDFREFGAWCKYGVADHARFALDNHADIFICNDPKQCIVAKKGGVESVYFMPGWEKKGNITQSILDMRMAKAGVILPQDLLKKSKIANKFDYMHYNQLMGLIYNDIVGNTYKYNLGGQIAELAKEVGKGCSTDEMLVQSINASIKTVCREQGEIGYSVVQGEDYVDASKGNCEYPKEYDILTSKYQAEFRDSVVGYIKSQYVSEESSIVKDTGVVVGETDKPNITQEDGQGGQN